MTRRAPAPPAPAAEPLPAAIPGLAALGLAILLLCTVPAVRAQQRLEREHARLASEAEAAAAEVERLRQELRDGTTQRYLRIRATQDLLHRGAGYVAERDRRLGRGDGDDAADAARADD